MKKFISKSVLYITAASLFTVGCSEDLLDDINKDMNNPTEVPAKNILADVIVSTAVRSVGGDLNTYMTTFVEHETGIYGQLYNAEIREGIIAPSTFNNSWNNIYENIKNTRIAIDLCSEGGAQEGNFTTRGIAQVLLAINSAILTNTFGDVPYSQAAILKEDKTPMYMTPKVDKQEEIYTEIMRLLDAAIVDLPKGDTHASGGMRDYDFLYGGNADLWLKLAYGLKARYTMQLLNRSANKTDDLNKVIEFVNNSFASASEQAAFNVYDASNLNPLFDFQWSREGLAASESLSKKLIERNDPRLRRVFVDKDWTRVENQTAANFLMAPNGNPEQKQGYYNTSIFVYAQTASTLLMSYHELLFLKAEAQVRLNDNIASQVTLKDAIVAAIANTEASVVAALNAPNVLQNGGLTETTSEITETEANSYFANNVLPLFTANPLKEIMIQKYLATFGASGETPIAYNDIRRLRALGEGDFIQLANPDNTSKFPLRCVYGSSDTTTNINVKNLTGDGTYIYTENVWWAGGTR
ncbi:MAG: SusD/RagB family nutrient-binding outer membrane lipoprotein [Capnocytophaga sp.]|nr:SusD/RagB family nutrient-binding outer membrane lipoprotein [Capnocytophaga sp.]